MTDHLLTEVREDGVMVATLNRPETLNSLSGEMGTALIEAVKFASESDEVRAFVLTGAGRGFCSGADTRAMISRGSGEGGPTRHQRMDRRGGSFYLAEAMAECDVPIIGAINGAAAGGGFGIALCCDVRFVAESARMGTIFIQRGVAADYGMSYWLPRLLGPAKAFEVAYEGNMMQPDRLLELGLANRVYADEELMEATLAYAAKIAAGPPLAYTGLRRLLMRSDNMPMHDFLEYEWTVQQDILRTEDCAEGFRAFAERRTPNFTGH
ncbi:MAG: enoyl-CoA hydratase/isomerase family protein [Dehalococcoidia bacterium]|nr:enoyl-CoA hydratase/isomerase family protein [Dehalococcoidia bacterium]